MRQSVGVRAVYCLLLAWYPSSNWLQTGQPQHPHFMVTGSAGCDTAEQAESKASQSVHRHWSGEHRRCSEGVCDAAAQCSLHRCLPFCSDTRCCLLTRQLGKSVRNLFGRLLTVGPIIAVALRNIWVLQEFFLGISVPLQQSCSMLLLLLYIHLVMKRRLGQPSHTMV